MATKYSEYIKTTYSTKYLPFGKEIITQEIVVMPDDADEFNKKMDDWKTDLQPNTMIELQKITRQKTKYVVKVA